MESVTLARKRSFNVDLTAIEGVEGTILCPRCSTLISPEDDTETTYKVVNAAFNNDGFLEGIGIECIECNSTIILDGFHVLARSDAHEGDEEAFKRLFLWFIRTLPNNVVGIYHKR